MVAIVLDGHHHQSHNVAMNDSLVLIVHTRHRGCHCTGISNNGASGKMCKLNTNLIDVDVIEL